MNNRFALNRISSDRRVNATKKKRFVLGANWLIRWARIKKKRGEKSCELDKHSEVRIERTRNA